MTSADPRDVASLAWSLSLTLSQGQGNEDSGMSEGGEELARACLVHASSHPSSYSPREMARLLSSLSAIEEASRTLLGGGEVARRGHRSLISSSSSSMSGRMMDSVLSRLSSDVLSSSLKTIEDLDLALSAFRSLRICDDLVLASAAELTLEAIGSPSSPVKIDVSSLVSLLFSLVLLSDRAQCHHQLLSTAASFLLPNLDLLTLDELVLASWTYSASMVFKQSSESDRCQPSDAIINLMGGLTLMLRSALPPPSLLNPSIDLTRRELQLLGQAHSASIIWSESQSVVSTSPPPPPLRVRKEIMSAWIELEASRTHRGSQKNGMEKATSEVVLAAESLGWIPSSLSSAREGTTKTEELMKVFAANPGLIALEKGGERRAVILSEPSFFVYSRDGKDARPSAEHRLKLDLIQAGMGVKPVALNVSQWAGASKGQREKILNHLLL
jgi:hypothetical protein